MYVCSLNGYFDGKDTMKDDDDGSDAAIKLVMMFMLNGKGNDSVGLCKRKRCT